MQMPVYRRRRRVVVADDDADLRALLARNLRQAGLEVSEVSDGNGLLAALGDDNDPSFELVVSDVHMPGNGGLAALAALRQRNSDVPVILITASVNSHLQNEAKSLGAAVIFAKPLDLAELREAVINLLGY